MLAKRRARPREANRASFVVAAILPLVLLCAGAVWSRQQQSSQQQQQSSQDQKQTPPAALQSAQPAPAQPATPPQAQSKITAQVKLVTLYATVRDKHGKIINDLTKDELNDLIEYLKTL